MDRFTRAGRRIGIERSRSADLGRTILCLQHMVGDGCEPSRPQLSRIAMAGARAREHPSRTWITRNSIAPRLCEGRSQARGAGAAWRPAGTDIPRLTRSRGASKALPPLSPGYCNSYFRHYAHVDFQTRAGPPRRGRPHQDLAHQTRQVVRQPGGLLIAELFGEAGLAEGSRERKIIPVRCRSSIATSKCADRRAERCC